MDNGKYTHLDIKRICENKLNIIFRSNGEFNGWFYYEGTKRRRITVSKGRKHVTPGTYGNMARQLGLTISEFDNFLDCSIDKNGFIRINDAKNWQRLL